MPIPISSGGGLGPGFGTANPGARPGIDPTPRKTSGTTTTTSGSAGKVELRRYPLPDGSWVVEYTDGTYTKIAPGQTSAGPGVHQQPTGGAGVNAGIGGTSTPGNSPWNTAAGGSFTPQAGGSASATGATYRPGGAAGSYLGDTGAGYIFSRPEAMLANQLGGASGGLYNMLAPMANGANELFALFNPQGGTNTNAQGLNFMADYWTKLRAPGNFINYEGAMGSLLNPRGMLGQLLGDANLDPREQTEVFSRFWNAIAGATQHPYFAQAMEQMMPNMASEYIGKAAQGKPGGPFSQYVARQSGLG
jgi:hypothetical protein